MNSINNNYLTLINKLSISNKRSIARLISIVESDDKKATIILKEIFHKTGNAYRIGITGPPGSGKSTITNQLTKHLLSLSKSVAIIAVDPTSPFSGGALLGDRVRMNDIGLLDNVFIRSMATRGSLGGLSKKTIDTADILDASGFDYIIFETVGVGQSELDIAKVADSTIVTLVPESGDSIQAMKAGLMEIADIFVLNKCDRPGADKAFISLQTTLHLRNFNIDSWQQPIIKTIATNNKGISEIVEKFEEHNAFCQSNSICKEKRLKNYKLRVIDIVETLLREKTWNELNVKTLENSMEKVLSGNLSPYELADKILRNI
ncbi:MAG: methylmalonyl Co-A mutase-associated GTPase MeaB [Melioribacteraceae bacterium]|nr:methylmalonyl Co-A mutase-associated GTPase MeaB [Melioribacteraceae bacterium]